MVKICAPDNTQWAFRFPSLVAFGRICLLSTSLHPALQIQKNFGGIDNGILLPEEYNAPMFKNVVFP